jgi:hypothetical protein
MEEEFSREMKIYFYIGLWQTKIAGVRPRITLKSS